MSFYSLLLAVVSLFTAPLLFADEFQARQGSYSTPWASNVNSACLAVDWNPNPEFTCGQYSDWSRCNNCNDGKNNYITLISRTSECSSYGLDGICLEVCPEDGFPVDIPDLDIFGCDRGGIKSCPDDSIVLSSTICPSLDVFTPPEYTCLDAISCFQEELSENPNCIDYTYDYVSPDSDNFVCLKESDQFVQEEGGPSLEEHLDDMGFDFDNPFEDYDSSSSSAADVAGAVQDSLHQDFSTVEHAINSQTDKLSDGLSDIDSELETTNSLLSQTNSLLSGLGDGGDGSSVSLGDENLTSSYMDRILDSTIVQSATVSFGDYDSTCEPYEFNFSSNVSGQAFDIDEVIDAHCTMLPEHAPILSFICIFASALFSIRIVLSA